MEKSPEAFRTISEVAEWLGTPTHVLRFWESRFTQVKPVKRAGGRRYYRPGDMELLGGIKKLLHEDGMTIRGVQKLLRESGARHVAGLSPPIDVSAAIDGTIEGKVVTIKNGDKMTPPDFDAPTEDAPADIDVIPEPLENILPFGGAPAAPDEISTDEFEIAQAEDSFTPAAKPPPARATFKPAEEPAADEAHERPHVPAFLKPDTDSPVEPAATTAEPTKPAPIVADVPDDPADDDASTPGITGVAASLRNAVRDSTGHKPNEEVLAELYDRLVGLRDRMDNRPPRDNGN